MALFADAHCHLDYPSFKEDIEPIILRAKQAGVVKVVTQGIDFNSNRKAVELSKRFEIVKAALGIYPPEALKAECKAIGRVWKELDIDEEIRWIRKQKFLAVGEIGMDFKGEFDTQKQEELFRKMISLAREMGKAVIIHSRKAEKEVIDVLEDEGYNKVVMHCFCGKKKLAEKIRGNNWFVTIPTNVVKSEQMQELVRMIDINHLLCETDAPFLSPFTGKRNEPAFVIEAYKKVAELKGMTLEDVSSNIFMNYKRVFE